VKVCFPALIATALASLTFAFAPAHAADPVRTGMTVGLHHNIDAVLFTPDGPGPFPGIMLLPTAFGLGPADESYCRKLAQSDYLCLIVDFTHATP
jgi:hypothetical protein